MDTAFDLITSGVASDDSCLSSVYEIEELLVYLQELNDKVEHLKGLAKFRKECTDKELGILNLQIDQFRKVILNTMKAHKPNQKTLQFPSVGKVSRKKNKSSWKIEDEAALIEYLRGKGDADSVVKTKESVDSRAAKKLVDNYVAGGDTVPGVAEVPENESVSITFEGGKPKEKKQSPENEAPPKASKKPTIDELSGLNV